jgi:hypothetical protein
MESRLPGSVSFVSCYYQYYLVLRLPLLRNTLSNPSRTSSTTADQTTEIDPVQAINSRVGQTRVEFGCKYVANLCPLFTTCFLIVSGLVSVSAVA